MDRNFFAWFLWPWVGLWGSKLPPLRTAHTRMHFCLNPFTTLGKILSNKWILKICFYLSFLYFIYFNKFYISVLTDFIITKESRKVILDNRINFGLYFSTVGLCFLFGTKRTQNGQCFERFNYLSAMKLFLSNKNSFWYSYVNGWFESVIKGNLPSRLKWRKDAFYLRWYFLYILFLSLLILLIVILLIGLGRKNIKFCYR